MKRILQIILCLFIGITALNAEPNPKAFLQIVNSLEKGEKKAIELITKQIKKDKKKHNGTGLQMIITNRKTILMLV